METALDQWNSTILGDSCLADVEMEGERARGLESGEWGSSAGR